jgi:hypothetical protein
LERQARISEPDPDVSDFDANAASRERVFWRFLVEAVFSHLWFQLTEFDAGSSPPSTKERLDLRMQVSSSFATL